MKEAWRQHNCANTTNEGLNMENKMTISWLNYSLAKWQSLGSVNKNV